MHEKEENERKELEKAMMIFMMNRSARILQKYQPNKLNIIKMYGMTFFSSSPFFFILRFRYWRNMVAKRKKKKGRRSGKKK
jgi:hypothetical protein